jgi:endonuclease/exonuclease/phosphatase family metal-dependent hydrolase
MKKLLSAFLLLLITNNFAFQQSSDTITVAFWNLENLFDVIDDPQKEDEEFLPSGDKEWTAERLDKKMYNLSRVIRSMNNDKGPDILGVCEVEHQHLLDTLVSKFLPDKKYKTAYLESPDGRGIDNGLIYNSKLFSLLSVKGDTVKLSDGYPTRLVLNVNLLSREKDTLHIYINHWPSRRGGETISEPNRISAAETLRSSVDENFSANQQSKIIILGDFNDEPGNISLINHLRASLFNCDSSEYYDSIILNLVNISYPDYAKGIGSYKYRDDWNMLDQVIISSSLIDNENFHYICNSFEVYKPEVMVTRSGKFEGTAFPTYGGKRYLGGYSDHYPVIAKFCLKKN